MSADVPATTDDSPPTSSFAYATAVEQVDLVPASTANQADVAKNSAASTDVDSDGGALGSGDRAVYRGFVHEGWDVFGNANGGYLMAIAARAISDWTGRPPATVTSHFLAPGATGEVIINLSAARIGRRFATVRASLFQGGVQLLEILAAVGEPRPGGFHHCDLTPPELPAFDHPSVMPTPAEIEVSPAIFSTVDARLSPEGSGFRRGEPSGVAEMTGWFSLGEEPIDEIALLLAADVFPPPMFNLDGPAGWVPTVELTVHVRARPQPGPLRCRFVTDYVADGLVGEDGEVWDSADRLVCQSRQLALVPRG